MNQKDLRTGPIRRVFKQDQSDGSSNGTNQMGLQTGPIRRVFEQDQLDGSSKN